jgi:hypothetical protein
MMKAAKSLALILAAFGFGQVSLQAGSLSLGMARAVKNQVNQLDSKVAGAQGISLTARASNLSSSSRVFQPRSTNVFAAPSIYRAALASCQLVKTTSDATPYTIFDSGLANANVITLTGNATGIGQNTSYPPPGTYLYMAVTVLYLEQATMINNFPTAGSSNNNMIFRIYFSTLAPNAKRDILVSLDSGNTWGWIATGAGGGLPWAPSSTKPPIWLTQTGGLNTTGWVTGQGGGQLYFQSPLDPITFLVPLATPLVIPQNPTGQWVLSMNFDTSQSLGWTDNNGDGKLDSGDPFWAEQPAITITAVNQ